MTYITAYPVVEQSLTLPDKVNSTAKTTPLLDGALTVAAGSSK
jgi:hypothetical protein